MRRYAQDTIVSVEKSKSEIESMLTKHGATSFMSGTNQSEAVIAFELGGRKIMFRLTLPDKASRQFTHAPKYHKTRSKETAYAAWEQACRSRFRALALAIKAKLEAVAVGITTFEDEFLSYVVLPDGLTVGQHLKSKITDIYDSGKVKPLLPDYSGSRDD